MLFVLFPRISLPIQTDWGWRLRWGGLLYHPLPYSHESLTEPGARSGSQYAPVIFLSLLATALELQVYMPLSPACYRVFGPELRSSGSFGKHSYSWGHFSGPMFLLAWFFFWLNIWYIYFSFWKHDYSSHASFWPFFFYFLFYRH